MEYHIQEDFLFRDFFMHSYKLMIALASVAFVIDNGVVASTLDGSGDFSSKSETFDSLKKDFRSEYSEMRREIRILRKKTKIFRCRFESRIMNLMRQSKLVDSARVLEEVLGQTECKTVEDLSQSFGKLRELLEPSIKLSELLSILEELKELTELKSYRLKVFKSAFNQDMDSARVIGRKLMMHEGKESTLQPLSINLATSAGSPRPLSVGFTTSAGSPRPLSVGFTTSAGSPRPLSVGFTKSAGSPRPLSVGFTTSLTTSTEAPQPSLFIDSTTLTGVSEKLTIYKSPEYDGSFSPTVVESGFLNLGASPSAWPKKKSKIPNFKSSSSISPDQSKISELSSSNGYKGKRPFGRNVSSLSPAPVMKSATPLPNISGRSMQKIQSAPLLDVNIKDGIMQKVEELDQMKQKIQKGQLNFIKICGYCENIFKTGEDLKTLKTLKLMCSESDLSLYDAESDGESNIGKSPNSNSPGSTVTKNKAARLYEFDREESNYESNYDNYEGNYRMRIAPYETYDETYDETYMETDDETDDGECSYSKRVKSKEIEQKKENHRENHPLEIRKKHK
jgi:hypothetical protein